MLMILMLMFGKGLDAAAPKSGVEVRGASGIPKTVPDAKPQMRQTLIPLSHDPEAMRD
jgi:hypothetical protein